MSKELLTCQVNGKEETCLIDRRDTLLEMLRNRLRLTGTKEGCSNGNCGSCTVMLDGQTACSCLVFAVEAQGREIMTIEGVAASSALVPVQEALVQHGGTQCGFCTPGIVMSALALFKETPHPTEEEVRLAIAGNICRCTGYDKIVSALMDVAEQGKPADV